MQPAPPGIMEAIVGLLLPPACREEVLGDLHERYTSTRPYIVDAISTLPLVIVSRIRRTTDPVVVLMEALALYTSFVLAAWWLDPALLYHPSGLLRLAMPVAVTLIAVVLGDVYANPAKRSPLKPILGVAFGVGFAFLSQAVLSAGNAELAVSRSIMITGGGLGLLLVSSTRMLFPPLGDRPQSASGPAFWQKQTVDPIRVSARQIRWILLMATVLYLIYQFRKY